MRYSPSGGPIQVALERDDGFVHLWVRDHGVGVPIDKQSTIFEQFARIGKALSSGRRLELLELLAQGERSVEGLAVETSQSVANTSQHLQVLRQAQLVESRREGNYIRYRLADEKVLSLWIAMRDLAQARPTPCS